MLCLCTPYNPGAFPVELPAGAVFRPRATRTDLFQDSNGNPCFAIDVDPASCNPTDFLEMVTHEQLPALFGDIDFYDGSGKLRDLTDADSAAMDAALAESGEAWQTVPDPAEADRRFNDMVSLAAAQCYPQAPELAVQMRDAVTQAAVSIRAQPIGKLGGAGKVVG